MTSTILLTGGTGNLGRQVAPLLTAAGRQVRVLSRGEHEPSGGISYLTGDLLSGTGIDEAVAGVDVVVHLAGGAKGDDRAAATLVRAATAARVGHLTHISVIGCDRMPLGYFRAKLGAERAIVDSGVPYTILRAAQFHDLCLTVARQVTRLPLLPAPKGLRFEPVDSSEVADRMATLALGEPAGLVRELAGPKVYQMDELVRAYLDRRGKHRGVLPVPLAGAIGRAYRAGDNLAADPIRAGRSWEDYLDAQQVTAEARLR